MSTGPMGIAMKSASDQVMVIRGTDYERPLICYSILLLILTELKQLLIPSAPCWKVAVMVPSPPPSSVSSPRLKGANCVSGHGRPRGGRTEGPRAAGRLAGWLAQCR